MDINDDQSLQSDSFLLLEWLSHHQHDVFNLLLKNFDVFFQTVLLVVLDGLLYFGCPENLRDAEDDLTWIHL
jgi:hypothetical protein